MDPSIKVFIFVVLLSGNIVFMSYKAALTSELSVRKEMLPFTSPEGFYNSRYKFVYNWKSIEQLFVVYKDYPHMQWFAKAFYDHENNEFIHSKEHALKAITQPYAKKAFLNYQEGVSYFSAYQCKVSMAWYFAYVMLLAMTMHRASPFFEIMNHGLLKQLESGIHNRVKAKYYGFKSMSCPKEYRGKPVGISKVFSTTSAFALAFATAVLMLVAEILHHSWHSQSKESHLTFSVRTVVFGYSSDVDMFIKVICSKYGPKSFDKRLQFHLELLKLCQE